MAFAFLSLAKLHLVPTCLWHQPPALTSSESIPGFISSHSAAIMEHLCCQRREALPTHASASLLWETQQAGWCLLPYSFPQSCQAFRNCHVFCCHSRRETHPLQTRALLDDTSASQWLNAAWEGSLLPTSPKLYEILSSSIRGTR